MLRSFIRHAGWLVVLAAASAVQANWTGPFSGTQNYNNTANWAGGVIDDRVEGTFSGGVVWRLNADRSTTGNGYDRDSNGYTGDLALWDTGGSADWRLDTLNGTQTLSLAGDFFMQRWGHGTITIGNSAAGNNLSIDLQGGTRRFVLGGGSDYVNVYANIANGGLTIQHNTSLAGGRPFRFMPTASLTYTGPTTVQSGFVQFDTAPASLSYTLNAGTALLFNGVSPAATAAITVGNGATLLFDGAGSALPATTTLNLAAGAILQLGNGGANHAANDRLPDGYVFPLGTGGTLRLRGTNGGSTTEAVSVALTGVGTLGVVHGTGATDTAVLTAAWDRTGKGIFSATGTDLGGAAAPYSRIGLSPVPTLLGGGGGAGTTKTSVVPFAIYNLGDTAVPTASTMSFCTYDGTTGLRPLSTTTEFVASSGSGAQATLQGAAADDNVRLALGNREMITLTGSANVNSLLIIAGNDHVLAGAGHTLTVNSGLLTVRVGNNPYQITVSNLSFGTAEGIIVNPQDSDRNRLEISSVIQGGGGLTLIGSAESRTPNANRDGIIQLSGSNTYTGKTTIPFGSVFTAGNERIPDGSTVALGQEGRLYIGSGNTETVAGLEGSGFACLQNTGTSQLILGGGGGSGGAVTLNSGGTVSPGFSVGTLSLGNTGDGTDFTMNGGTLNLEIGAGGAVDRLVVAGDITLAGGALSLGFLDGYNPPWGSRYAILSGLSITDPNGGAFFDSVTSPIAEGLGFEVVGGTLFMHVPEPGVLALLAAAAGLLLARARRRG